MDGLDKAILICCCERSHGVLCFLDAGQGDVKGGWWQGEFVASENECECGYESKGEYVSESQSSVIQSRDLDKRKE